MAQSTEMPETVDNQNMLLNSDNVENDDLAIIREKRLFMMSRCAIVTACVSVCAIIVGLLAILTSESVPYRLGGGIIAGGMALLMTICPFCMLMEGGKTSTGTNMTKLFNFNLVCMIVWFSFTLCGIFIAFGIPGLWGMIECIFEKQKQRHTFRDICTDQTNEKLIFSILTVVLSAVLGTLTIVITCIVCCNAKAFGYKTIRHDRYEFYREMIRREIQQEAAEHRTNERRDQARDRNWYEGNRTNRQEDNERGRQGFVENNDREYPREPSAPPLENNDMYIENRRPPERFQDHPEGAYYPGSPYDRFHPHRPDYDSFSWTTHGQTSRYLNQGDGSGREQNLENDTEAPPPSYNDVVNKYSKADGV